MEDGVIRATFVRYVGVDYSGCGDPAAGNPCIQVFEADPGGSAQSVRRPGGGEWSRAAVAGWLFEQMAQSGRLIVGIDHAFSFPREKTGDSQTWNEFLVTFRNEWRTDERPVTKIAIAQSHPDCGKLLRLTEQWTSSAKSVFNCNGPGVACSTFAGLPWLLRIREKCGDAVFFWPFDGWTPPSDRHVIAEVYPSLFRNRYRASGLKNGALDAFAVAEWLKDVDSHGFLDRYFHPPLTRQQEEQARIEGWILGVS